MFKEKLNETELVILRLFPHEEITISQVAGTLHIDVSWASRCIIHLEKMGFLTRNRTGYKTYVHLADTSLGSALSALIVEEPAMNLNILLGGPSLQILPLLLAPGMSTNGVVERTKVSTRTVQNRIKRWRAMGVVILEQKKYVISQRHPLVIKLIQEYTNHRNLSHVKERYPEATIVWQDRGEYIITLDHEITDSKYSLAGSPRIAEHGYDIVFRNYYYHFNPGSVQVGEAESLVQTVKFNIINPRPLEYVREAIENNQVSKREIRKYAKKYKVSERVEEAL